MSLLSRLKGPGKNGFGYGSTAEDVTEGLDLTGKTYLITGCNSGLGLETARVLALRGAHIMGAARTREKAAAALASAAPRGAPVSCDLAEPDSIRRCVEEIMGMDRPLDGIIANAGIMALPELDQRQGYELQFFTNHVGHYLLVTGLLGRLAEDGRVVMVSSRAHERAPKEGIQFDNLSGEAGYSPWTAYGQSKLANLLFARSLARRLPGPKQTANALHPGVIATNLGRHMSPVAQRVLSGVEPLFLKSIPEGTATQVYVAAHPDAAAVSGEYWADCNVAESSKHGRDTELAERLWKETEGIVGRVTEKT